MEEQERRTASLTEFIEAARARGASDDLLAGLLERQGWQRKEIYSAYASLYERLTGLSIPTRAGHLAESARDAFLYLLSFGTLATWTCGLGSLFFTLINLHFPDPVAPQQFLNPNVEISGAIASLIVAYPLYLLTMRLLIRGVQAQPEKLESGVRKWLTYIALLIASATAIIDLVTFLSYFLRGELTARFALKVLTVLAIAGGVFSYYLLWLERPVERQDE
jgi:succinate dehydrogenase hydrophobic anchor subunit